ncbi:MAG: tetratricopeptide repeat protein [Glaciecola sp.]
MKYYQIIFTILICSYTSASYANYSKTEVDCINYFLQKDYEKAFPVCVKSYNKTPKYISAVNTGIMHLLGRGTNRNIERALSLFKEASQLDGSDGTAEHNLGYAFSEGIGVSENLQHGFEWTKRAAHLGHEGSQFNLAISYFDGEGVPRNNAQGYAWLKIARDSKSKDAASILLNIKSQLTSATVRKGESIYQELRIKLPISRIARREKLMRQVQSITNL